MVYVQDISLGLMDQAVHSIRATFARQQRQTSSGMSVILGHSGGSYPAFLPGQESRYKADFLHTTIATSSKPVEQRVYPDLHQVEPFRAYR